MQILLSEKILGGLGILLLVGAVALTVWLSQRQQELRQRAQVTSCQVERAICKWDSVGAGYSYKVNIIDVSTGTIIVSSSVTNTQLSFPASPGKTYRCEVSAVNACGEGTKTTSSNSACPGVQAQAPAIVSTPTPTPTPIPTPTPTPTPVAPTPTPVTIQATPTPPTPTPVVIVQAPPTSLPAVGPADILAKFGGGALLFTIIGIILLFVL